MKLGYNTWSMPTLAFGEAARHCAGLGFDSVEVTVSEGWTTDVMKIGRSEPAEWKRIIGETGLVITSLTANAPDVEVDLTQSRLFNADLAPVPQSRRKWGMLSFAALWTGSGWHAMKLPGAAARQTG